jgi:hypothetical protein
VSCFDSMLRKHAKARGSTTVRFQSRATIDRVFNTCAMLRISMPAWWKSASAAPVKTRSDCFGL